MQCPLCQSKLSEKIKAHSQEEATVQEFVLFKCSECTLLFLEDYAKDRDYLYGEHYSPWSHDTGIEREIAKSKKIAFRRQLKVFEKVVQLRGKKTLDIGAGGGYLMECVSEAGAEAFGLEISPHYASRCQQKFPGQFFLGDLFSANFSDEKFDIIFMTDVLEHLAEPVRVMREVERILKPGGYLFLISPDTDSWTRKIMRSSWFQYKHEHVMLYNRKSLEVLLKKNELELQLFLPNKKRFNLNYYAAYFQKYSLFGLEKIFLFLFNYFPKWLRNFYFTNPMTGEFIAIVRKEKV
jgi:2-polyprenyl-3-methyl-5-hydroxy-6-metoxy-1,4-benzoquinol methylase